LFHQLDQSPELPGDKLAAAGWAFVVGILAVADRPTVAVILAIADKAFVANMLAVADTLVSIDIEVEPFSS